MQSCTWGLQDLLARTLASDPRPSSVRECACPATIQQAHSPTACCGACAGAAWAPLSWGPPQAPALRRPALPPAPQLAATARTAAWGRPRPLSRTGRPPPQAVRVCEAAAWARRGGPAGTAGAVGNESQHVPWADSLDKVVNVSGSIAHDSAAALAASSSRRAADCGEKRKVGTRYHSGQCHKEAHCSPAGRPRPLSPRCLLSLARRLPPHRRSQTRWRCWHRKAHWRCGELSCPVWPLGTQAELALACSAARNWGSWLSKGLEQGPQHWCHPTCIAATHTVLSIAVHLDICPELVAPCSCPPTSLSVQAALGRRHAATRSQQQAPSNCSMLWQLGSCMAHSLLPTQPPRELVCLQCVHSRPHALQPLVPGGGVQAGIQRALKGSSRSSIEPLASKGVPGGLHVPCG
jgi:hypothetical protein